MDLHEYQSKKLMMDFGVTNILDGFVIGKRDDVKHLDNEILFEKNKALVIKAQVHAGGRGKAGGVKVCKSKEEAIEYSERLLNSYLVTKQTSSDGQYVSALYCESGCNIDKEFYLSMLVDREKKAVTIIVSTEGGMDIEEVAYSNPEKILSTVIDSDVGYTDFQTRKVLYFLNLDYQKYFAKLNPLLFKLYNFFVSQDVSLLEINPLVLTKGDLNNVGEFIVLDAKVSIDENSLFRHQDIKAMRDRTQEGKLEAMAKDNNLSYVKLDGSIGCMVNGAGLAMATMDIVQYYGAKPANFLDVGGGADKEGVKTALNIILDDKDVKAILVNIFGGIVRCDMIADAIVSAAMELKESGKNIPKMVVRLSGTNSKEGAEIINKSSLDVVSAMDFDEAARKVVACVK